MSTQKKDKKQSALVMPAPLDSQIIEAPKVTPSTRFPIVGIGASAGGLAAFEELLTCKTRHVKSLSTTYRIKDNSLMSNSFNARGTNILASPKIS